MTIKPETQRFLTDYYFDRLSGDFATSTIKVDMAREMLTTHGAGGKFAEVIMQAEYGIEDTGSIHDFDGYVNDRAVEMKMETVCSNNLCAKGSYPEHRDSTPREDYKDQQYLRDRPLLLNFGTCDETGKCIYAMCLDTAKLPEDSMFFERLGAKSPRVQFSQYAEHTDAYRLLFLNQSLFDAKRDNFVKHFAIEIERMHSDQLKPNLAQLMS